MITYYRCYFEYCFTREVFVQIIAVVIIITENVVMKDNPAFSMIHDSEDEDATTLPVTSVYTKSRTSKAVTNNTSLLYSSEEEENHRNIPCHFNGRTDDSD